MTGKPRGKRTIALKLTRAFFVILLIQCVVMSAALVFGGAIWETQNNEFKYFTEKTNSTKTRLEGEMKNVWTNFQHYTNQISQSFSESSIMDVDGVKTSEEKLLEITPYLTDALRETKTTGVFLILDDDVNGDGSHSAVYLKSLDPTRNSWENFNFLMRVGPWSIAEKYEITTQDNWSFQLTLDENNQKFYDNAISNIGLSEDERLLGYWSTPFQLTEKDEEVITYTIPLMDKKGKTIGVFGIDITLQYLNRFIKMEDKIASDFLGYIIAKKNENGAFMPLNRSGGLRSSVLAEDEELHLSQQNEKEKVYELLNHNGSEKIYASVNQMGIYYNNTPYEDQQWYLIGLMNHDQLFEMSDKITRIMLYSSLATLAVGLLVSILLSRWFTKPIITLAEQVNKNSYGKLQILEMTGLKEIDELSTTIFNSHKRLLELSAKVSRIIDLTNIPFGAYEISRVSDNVFITNHLQELFNFTDEEIIVLCSDKRLFLKRLEDIKKNSAEDGSAFLISKSEEERWIRITQTETEDALLGVVMDATDEILQARHLRYERDSDALTGIRNRIAFQRMFDYHNSYLQDNPNIGIGLFDLNNLKKVNDELGHDKGDEYICDSTKIICEIFRCSAIFRIGGDEFVAIFNGLERHQIETYHEQMKEKEKMHNNCRELKLGIAFGYAIFDKVTDKDLNDTLKRADIRMYENKKVMKAISF